VSSIWHDAFTDHPKLAEDEVVLAEDAEGDLYFAWREEDKWMTDVDDATMPIMRWAYVKDVREVK